jgi:hypothetical protein
MRASGFSPLREEFERLVVVGAACIASCQTQSCLTSRATFGQLRTFSIPTEFRESFTSRPSSQRFLSTVDMAFHLTHRYGSMSSGEQSPDFESLLRELDDRP